MMGAQGMMGPAIAGSVPPLPVRPLLAAAHHQQTVAASVVPPPSLPAPTKYQVCLLSCGVSDPQLYPASGSAISILDPEKDFYFKRFFKIMLIFF
jgi:hypothetical protein